MRISDWSSDVCSSDLLLPQGPSLGMPEDQAGRFVLEMEQVEIAADLAVVAALGLFEHVQVGVLVVFGGPGRAVDALEHLVVAVGDRKRVGWGQSVSVGVDAGGRQSNKKKNEAR